MGQPPAISVVVPSYGCASCLGALHERICAALEPLVPSFELVLVDDASPANDWAAIAELAKRDPRVRGVKLARNFGQHYAIAAGLDLARGDHVVVMDCDLQDRPEEIPRLYQRALEGTPCVFARRVERRDSASKVAVSRLFARVHAWLSGTKADATVGNFSVISRKVVQALRGFKERNRNYALQVHWLGFRTAYVDVEHASRHSGKSTYTLGKQLRHALETILSQSTRPLYASAGLGLGLALSAVVAAGYLVYRKLTYGYGVAGWASVMVALFFLFGMLFLNLGILGLYLGSVFLELKGRPVYVVEETTWDSASITAGAER